MSHAPESTADIIARMFPKRVKVAKEQRPPLTQREEMFTKKVIEREDTQARRFIMFKRPPVTHKYRNCGTIRPKSDDDILTKEDLVRAYAKREQRPLNDFVSSE